MKKGPDKTPGPGIDPFEEFTLGSGSHAILCIHGLGCAPILYYEVGRELADMGYTVRSILLPGHGTTLKDFAETPWTAWYDKVEREYAALAGKYDRISVIGFSIGSMLGTKLASEKQVERLALLGPPYYIIRRWFPLRVALKTIGRFASKVPTLRMSRRFRTAEGWVRHSTPMVDYFPLSTIATVDALARNMRPLVKEISCPTVIIVSRCDLSADPRSGKVMMRRLKIKEKELLTLSWSHHQLLQGCQRHRVLRKLIEFFKIQRTGREKD
jgi:carboxylesterase